MIPAALIVSSCGLFSAWTSKAHDWALTALDDNSLALVVAVGSSNCDRFEQVEVAETDTEVTITAVVSQKEARHGIFGAGCNADLNIETVEIVLEQPLGTKSLSGCAPGDSGLEDYFGQIAGGRAGDDCAEVVAWR